MMKKLLKLVLGLLLLFVIYIVVTLIHGTLTDYQPPLETELRLEQSSGQLVIQDSILSFAIWNLGYAGLGKESDFFFSDGSSLLSGGRMVRSSEELVEKNLAGIEQFLKGTRSDFFMLQEVDYDSKRSYGHNQFALAQESLPAYAAAKATNYQVKRVPLPVLEPWNVYGKVWGGLATLGRYQPLESKRLQLPGEYAWPTRIFQLDRCILYQQYAVKDDRKLTLLNVHNSAYDGGVLKAQQMEYLKNLVLEEYEKGNYVIVGGDWNMCPPNFPFDSFMPGGAQGFGQINIPMDFLPVGWQWVYDPTTATNRKNATPYVKGETFITLIDFYLVSPNVFVKNIKGINQEFNYSDHQPVWMEVELR